VRNENVPSVIATVRQRPVPEIRLPAKTLVLCDAGGWVCLTAAKLTSLPERSAIAIREIYA
jgi:hypothetical protein